jgi:aspartate racemase
MVMDFYKRRLKYKGIEAIIPRADDREFIQNTINQELIKNVFRKESKDRFLGIMNVLYAAGAQGIILGCTEIPLLIGQNDTHIPLFNTLEIHARAAVEYAIAD